MTNTSSSYTWRLSSSSVYREASANAGKVLATPLVRGVTDGPVEQQTDPHGHLVFGRALGQSPAASVAVNPGHDIDRTS